MEFHRSHPRGRDPGRVLQEERQFCRSELPSERPYGGLLVLLSTDGKYIYIDLGGMSGGGGPGNQPP